MTGGEAGKTREPSGSSEQEDPLTVGEPHADVGHRETSHGLVAVAAIVTPADFGEHVELQLPCQLGEPDGVVGRDEAGKNQPRFRDRGYRVEYLRRVRRVQLKAALVRSDRGGGRQERVGPRLLCVFCAGKSTLFCKASGVVKELQGFFGGADSASDTSRQTMAKAPSSLYWPRLWTVSKRSMRSSRESTSTIVNGCFARVAQFQNLDHADETQEKKLSVRARQRLRVAR